MDTHSSSAPEPVLLIIADISGYTRYMTANAKTLAHSQTIITELVKAIVKQAELPLEVAKLEGDAVFLYCRRNGDQQSWQETKRLIGQRVLTFFQMFREKVGELSQSTTCTCNACTHIEKLQLKVVVHSGEALFHRVINFLELAGVDVIIAHRLLKNSVTADQYLLLTQTARNDMDFPEEIHLVSGHETYDDLGRIDTLVYLPGMVGEAGTVGPGKDHSVEQTTSVAIRFGKSWHLFCKLWFSPLVSKFGARNRVFRNVVADTSAAGRISFALLTLILTPLYLPIGTLFVLVHAFKAPPLSQPHRPHDHEHKPDGSCCTRPGD